jgi:alpha-N-arabinofuranosidase
MILTPTYHVFNMYKVHQDATYIPVMLQSEDYKAGNKTIPAVSGTASMKDGKTHISLSNLDPNKKETIVIDVEAGSLKKVNTASLLTAPKINSINTFDEPGRIKPVDFSNYSLKKGTLTVTLPPKAIVTLELE